MMLISLISGDEKLLGSLQCAVNQGEEYMLGNRQALAEMARSDWSQVVVLADGEIAGIAEEGALAFTEISMLPSRFCHTLDVRHGPIVLVGGDTLVVMALPTGVGAHQVKLIGDLKARGAKVVVFSAHGEACAAADAHFTFPRLEPAAMGIPFIYIPQALSLFKALANGINPDAPSGLDPWIKL
jgi:fructoselysine-6-P-deglycase FrlB-like protein